jgi:hypothetical protein
MWVAVPAYHGCLNMEAEEHTLQSSHVYLTGVYTMNYETVCFPLIYRYRLCLTPIYYPLEYFFLKWKCFFFAYLKNIIFTMFFYFIFEMSQFFIEKVNCPSFNYL